MLRHKTSKKDKATLQGASGATYAALLEVATEAVVKCENDVFLSFHYSVKFQKGFPKGILVQKTETSNVYKVKARRLLDFLFDIGESKFNSRMLVGNKRAIEKHLNNLENGFIKSYEIKVEGEEE